MQSASAKNEKIELREYNFPDSALLENPGQPAYLVWQPDFTCIILGSSNKISESLHLKNILADGVPVYKRPTGGESVILSREMLVASVSKPQQGIGAVKKYFKEYNNILERALSGLGVKDLGQKGISDISIGNQKIVGCAIHQNRERVFYHAVLNWNESVELMEKYLRHPGREPDYRLGRKHEDFVTCLKLHAKEQSLADVKAAIEKEFDVHFKEND